MKHKHLHTPNSKRADANSETPKNPAFCNPPARCAFTRLADVASLKPNPRNPNKHPDRQLDLLAKVIAHQGWRRPPVVSKQSGLLVTGHGAVEAARRAGWSTVPIDEQDFATPEDETAHMIADNQLPELAEIDSDALRGLLKELDGKIELDLSGFDRDALTNLGGLLGDSEVDAEPQIDHAAELQKEWRTARGQLWQLGDHYLGCGDSTDAKDVRRLMDGAPLAQLLFTSPPYAQQRDYRDNGKVSDWDTLMQGVFLAAPLADGAQVLVNLGLVHNEGEWLPYWDKWIQWMRGEHWRRFGWYVWDQGPGLPGDWNGRLAPAHEFIFHLNKEARQPNKTQKCKHAGETNHGHGLRKEDGTVGEYSHAGRDVQETKIPDSVIRITREKRSTQIQAAHPAVFPVELANEIISAWDGDPVYDPFSGSGTTIIACERLGRKCRAMEISPAYVAVALQRFKDATGKQPRLTNG